MAVRLKCKNCGKVIGFLLTDMKFPLAWGSAWCGNCLAQGYLDDTFSN